MHKRRHPRSKAFWLIPGSIVAILIFFQYQQMRYQELLKTPVDPSDSKSQSFIVEKGENLNEISKSLKEKDLIIDEGALKNYLKSQGLDRKIVAGRFILERSQTIPEIAGIITNSKKSQTVVTIPEGYTVNEIDGRLTELQLILPGEFDKAVKDFTQFEAYPFIDKAQASKLIYPLEGYLFPDTYYVDTQNFKSEDLIQMMLADFKNKLGDELNKQHAHTMAESIIMASIIEKEVRTEKDTPIVAGVLWKRLDENWMLGADATLLYLKDDRSIYYKDLKNDSPYNTRNHAGLPPGPIGNPGLRSILAALNPQESPYYYYLTKPGTGEVVYAKTNDEHNRNKAMYLN